MRGGRSRGGVSGGDPRDRKRRGGAGWSGWGLGRARLPGARSAVAARTPAEAARRREAVRRSTPAFASTAGAKTPRNSLPPLSDSPPFLPPHPPTPLAAGCAAFASAEASFAPLAKMTSGGLPHASPSPISFLEEAPSGADASDACGTPRSLPIEAWTGDDRADEDEPAWTRSVAGTWSGAVGDDERAWRAALAAEERCAWRAAEGGAGADAWDAAGAAEAAGASPDACAPERVDRSDSGDVWVCGGAGSGRARFALDGTEPSAKGRPPSGAGPSERPPLACDAACAPRPPSAASASSCSPTVRSPRRPPPLRLLARRPASASSLHASPRMASALSSLASPRAGSALLSLPSPRATSSLVAQWSPRVASAPSIHRSPRPASASSSGFSPRAASASCSALDPFAHTPSTPRDVLSPLSSFSRYRHGGAGRRGVEAGGSPARWGPLEAACLGSPLARQRGVVVVDAAGAPAPRGACAIDVDLELDGRADVLSVVPGDAARTPFGVPGARAERPPSDPQAWRRASASARPPSGPAICVPSDSLSSLSGSALPSPSASSPSASPPAVARSPWSCSAAKLAATALAARPVAPAPRVPARGLYEDADCCAVLAPSAFAAMAAAPPPWDEEGEPRWNAPTSWAARRAIRERAYARDCHAEVSMFDAMHGKSLTPLKLSRRNSSVER